MSIRSEQLKFDIIVNDNKAQKKLLDLGQANNEISKSISSLREAKKKLNDEDKKTVSQINKLNSALSLEKENAREIGLTIRELTLEREKLAASGEDNEAQIKELNIQIEKQNQLLTENKTKTESLRKEKKELTETRKINRQEIKRTSEEIKLQSENISKNKQEMQELRKEIGLTALTPKQLRAEMKKLKAQLDNTADPTAIKKLNAEYDRFQTQLDKTTGKARKTNKSLQQQQGIAGGLRNNISLLSVQITALIASFTGLIAGAMKIINVRAEFQKFEAVLTNTLGTSSLAQQALRMIQDFAAKTPFAVAELTDSFVKLVNQGFKPTEAEMTNLGDIAASQGKSFDQLTEALIDAQVGEFERLKEFGIRASKSGDEVEFTFKGVKKQVDFTDESIREYILSLGQLEGVSGSMAAISATLGGQISNLEDNFTNLLNEVGEGSEDIFSKFILLLNQLIESVRSYVSGDGKDFISFFNELSDIIFSIRDIYKSLFKETGQLFEAFSEISKALGLFTDAGSAAQIVITVLSTTLKIALFPLRLLIGAITVLIKSFTWVIENVPFVQKQIERLKEQFQLLSNGAKAVTAFFTNIIDQLYTLANNSFPETIAQIKDFLAWLGVLDEQKSRAKGSGLFSQALGLDFFEENQAEFEAQIKKTQALIDKNSKKRKELTKEEKDELIKIEKEYQAVLRELGSGTREQELKEEQEAFNKRKALFTGNAEALKALNELHHQNVLAINKKYDELELQQKIEAFEQKQQKDAELFELEQLQKQLDAEKLAQSDEELSQIEAEKNAERLEFEKKQADELTDYLISLDQDATKSKIDSTNIAIQQQQLLTQKTQEEAEKRTKIQEEQNKLFLGFAEQAGEILGEAIFSGQNLFESFGKQIILSGLDVLKKLIQIQIAQATGYSLASAESVATFGAAGFAKAALMAGLIEGAFSAVKAQVSQFKDGRYDVVGASDGKLYENTPYIGAQNTGYLPHSAALISESGQEAIISAKDLRNPKIRSLFNEIRYVSMKRPQFQDGRLPDTGTDTQNVTNEDLFKQNQQLIALMIKYTQSVDSWANNFQVVLNTSELGDNQTQKKKLKSGTETASNLFKAGTVDGSNVVLNRSTLFKILDNRYLD